MQEHGEIMPDAEKWLAIKEKLWKGKNNKLRH